MWLRRDLGRDVGEEPSLSAMLTAILPQPPDLDRLRLVVCSGEPSYPA
jgi:hypothetical protein